MTTQTAPRTRRLNHVIKTVDDRSRRNGQVLDLSEDSPAYVSHRKLNAAGIDSERVVSGAKLTGSYEMKTGAEGERYADLDFESVIAPAAGDKRNTGALTREVSVKNVTKTKDASGFLIWSKNPRHSRPVFARAQLLRGIDIMQVKKANATFFEKGRRLIATTIEVIETR